MLLRNAYTRKTLLDSPPKRIILSGPSGFLGRRVLDSILKVHKLRIENGLKPGEIVLLSGGPGRLMERLYRKYGASMMNTVRASRVDYYTQHSVDTWVDHLGSLGAEGSKAVFVNLAAVAGPVEGVPDAMMDVNYKAPAAASRAAEKLGFGHWVQSSTQATNAERAGQVPYSKGKAMLDFALTRAKDMPVTIACLGLLYSKEDGLIGQERKGTSKINLIDLALLPLTPIMGDGSAPLQPLEVIDASDRIAFLALTDPSLRPLQAYRGAGGGSDNGLGMGVGGAHSPPPTFRYYDAVGPQTMSILEMLSIFAKVQGNTKFRPVFIDYRNMEKLLNIQSLGNLNRQFVSLLRSEQETLHPVIGDHTMWERVLGGDALDGPASCGVWGGDHQHAEEGDTAQAYRGCRLVTLQEAFAENEQVRRNRFRRHFPYLNTLRFVMQHPKLVVPGIQLGLEITRSYLSGNTVK